MNKLRRLWANTKSSLWFVPMLMVGSALALAFGLVEADGVVSREFLTGYPRLFGAGTDAARGMLSAIAGSMITVAGLTFSLTIVAITQASSQYTPRVLRNFIRDRGNQFVLGYFVGVFAYCLVVLRTIRGGDEGRFIPSLAVFFGMLLAISSVGVLIYFIHHTAASIQASSIISGVAEETIKAIERMFPETTLVEFGGMEDARPERAQSTIGEWQTIAAAETGYIQSVNMKRLLKLAEEYDTVLRMEVGTGGYVVKGAPLASYAEDGGRRAASFDEKAAENFNDCYTFNHYRTIDQDAAFGIRQLVDIALKALSPGVNDTTTAITCIDYLGSILAECAARQIANYRCGKDGRVRVVSCRPTFIDLVAEAFDQIRDSAEGNAAVMLRQLKAIETICALTPDAARRRILLKQVALIADATGRSIESEYNRARITERIERVRRAHEINTHMQIPLTSESSIESPGAKEQTR